MKNEIQLIQPVDKKEQTEVNKAPEVQVVYKNIGFWGNVFEFIKFMFSLLFGFLTLLVFLIIHPFGWIGIVLLAVAYKIIF